MAKLWFENAPSGLVLNLTRRSPLLILIGGSICCLSPQPLLAQVSADDSLGTETTTEDNVTEITGGTRAEGNLFHSFQEFSVETGGTAFFNNGTDVSNIIGRVTGGNLSNIDGLVRANGAANLILINPNGISFGNNARLDIGGSFLGSTAESVVFEDGNVFNTDLNTQPLLTISTPVGLQLGQNAGTVEVLGNGDPETGLGVAPGNTFALLGNGITLDGGAINVESGRIDLGSVARGTVSLTEIEAGWQLGYEGVTELADLNLLSESVLFNPNLAVNSTGGIQLWGRDIALERSQINAQTSADKPGGNISINAAESLTLAGDAPAGANASSIANNVTEEGTGRGGSIEIVTERLEIEPRSFIDSTAFGAGTAGKIDLKAAEINLRGAGFEEFQQRYRLDPLTGDLQPGSRLTGIFAGTAVDGSAGQIAIETDALNLTNGAIIFSPTFTTGSGADIEVDATEINLDASAIQVGGGIESSSDAVLGDINLTSDRLNVSNGAAVINLTFGNAPGGNIDILADAIDLSDTPLESIVRTGLFTNTTLGAGSGGDLTIDTKTLNIDRAAISSNSGAILPDGEIVPIGGKGGNIEIKSSENIAVSGLIFNPDNPELSRTAGIESSTYSASDGGNVSLDTDRLTVEAGANIASATFNAGDGGQIEIDARDSVEITGFTSETGMTRGGLFASSGTRMPSEPEQTGASGSIEIATPQLTVQDGALIDVQSTNISDAGSIELNTESITIANRGTLSATTQDAEGGNIQINTNKLQLDRGLINASVLGQGTGGNIEIAARDSIEIKGESFAKLQAALFDPNILSQDFLASLNIDVVSQGILAATIGSGSAGTIDLQSENIAITQGGLVATASGGNGSAGTIALDASESLVIDGSFVSNNTLFDGQGGDVTVNTGRLEVLGGGQITVSSLGTGNSGSVSIEAVDSVRVLGNTELSTVPSSISVGTVPLPGTTGDGGDLSIRTGDLNIDGGQISISSTSTGDAGTLRVEGESISLDNGGSIVADTQSGSGGNITLDASNIIWRGSSSTTATAAAEGDGGNIFINADSLIALEGSQIKADAFVGMGGNVSVNAEGLFICPSCQVSASSELGLDGVVEIEALEPNTINALEVPQATANSQEEVAVACASETDRDRSQLTVTGRGGLPNRPQKLLNAQSLIEFPTTENIEAENTEVPVSQVKALPAPAQSWHRDEEGNIILSARADHNYAANSKINSVDCHR